MSLSANLYIRCSFTANDHLGKEVANKHLLVQLGSCKGGEEQRETTQGKVVGAQKDIHQHREESSRARGMLASRVKSESFA